MDRRCSNPFLRNILRSISSRYFKHTLVIIQTSIILVGIELEELIRGSGNTI
jgi:hypothetical protein